MAPTRTRALLRALMHPIRATLEKHVHAAGEPVPIAELAQLLGLSMPIARYHAQALEAFGLISLDEEERVAAT